MNIYGHSLLKHMQMVIHGQLFGAGRVKSRDILRKILNVLTSASLVVLNNVCMLD